MDWPFPEDAKFSVPGLALASAISSRTLFAGKLGVATRTSGPCVSSVTGAGAVYSLAGKTYGMAVGKPVNFFKWGTAGTLNSSYGESGGRGIALGQGLITAPVRSKIGC